MARTSSTRNTAAKKTTKTTARKTPGPRTTRSTAKKTTPAPAKPRLSLIKTDPTPAPATVPADTRRDLPTRHNDFVTTAQIYAHNAARHAGVPTHLIRDWHDHRNGTATRPLADGSYLHYNHATRALTWHARCPMGAVHVYTLTAPSTATAARVHADRCNRPHASLDHIQPLTRDELAAYGIHTSPTLDRPIPGEPATTTKVVPLPEREPEPRALADQLARTHADAADTQPLSRDQIAAGLEARADNDQPKEHPQP